ncbi:MAG: agmatine deiminase family protein [Hellea sp.]
MTKELIILAPPPDGDKYYAGVKRDIFDFHVAYARQILTHDDVLIFSGKDLFDDYVTALGAAHVAPFEMQDIWMRDFSPQNAAMPVMMRYTAEGQGGGRKGQSDADVVQEALADVLDKTGISFGESDLLNDGGNFVDDYAGNVVLSRKFLRDNNLNETQGRKAVRDATGAVNVAFIEADEQGGLEHADGVEAFIDKNVLVVNSYPGDAVYAAELKADLRRGLPGVTIHDMITPYDGSKIYDPRFGSACGLYTNMLVTPNRIYLPQFGIPEDAKALADMRHWTTKTVIPVMSSQVCQMGGGVRCMSWQSRGEQADKVLASVRQK